MREVKGKTRFSFNSVTAGREKGTMECDRVSGGPKQLTNDEYQTVNSAFLPPVHSAMFVFEGMGLR